MSSAFAAYEELCSLEGCYYKVKSRDYQERIKLHPLLLLPKKGKNRTQCCNMIDIYVDTEIEVL